jgi:hypothetical protein
MKNLINCNDGGLGNRLLPMLSSLIIAKKTGYNYRSFWQKNRTCDIDLEKLFNLEKLHPITLEEICETKPHITKIKNLQTKKYVRDTLYKPENNSGFFDLSKDFDELIKKGKDVYFDFHHVIPSASNDRSLFPKEFSNILRQDIKTKILKLKEDLGLDKNTIGAHIRGTDVRGLKITKVIERIKKNQTSNFFICSDEKEFEDELKGRSNVAMCPKQHYVEKFDDKNTFRRNCNRSEDQVMGALIDLACLSFCDLSDGGYHSRAQSTFLYSAKIISGWENSQ